MVRETLSLAVAVVVFRPVAGQGNDHSFGQRWFRAQLPYHLVTAGAWQADVQEDYIGFKNRCGLVREATVVNGLNVVLSQPEQHGEAFSRVLIIFHNENAAAGFR
ncbi:MAG TPA: hypothetical protein VG099_15535, partial [Gemmataceae bacterium]|nr:hypothetical protein [Gemmataceae bacterium]